METEDKKSELARREEEILRFWQENKIFEKSLNRPTPGGEFVFYEGPPTANARPCIHHVESRAFKDLILRYKTMRGFHCPRKAGWDTHGLPVEIEVERELGLKTKKEIEEYGVAKFNQRCRESVQKYKAEWEKFTDRTGFWLDQKNPYITYEPKYIESLWHIVKKVNERGLLYRDYKVLPWCPRCGTALSSHELAQGYRETPDPAVFVKFKVKSGQKIGDWTVNDQTYFVAWTTTPWTLPGNVALAAGKNIEYLVMVRGSETYIVSTRLWKQGGLGEFGHLALAKDYKGSDLVGLEYKPLFDFSELQNDKSHRVYLADFVTTDEGTGIVHTAVMYGVDDFELGTKVGLPKHHLVAEDGTFVAGTPWAGKFVKDADAEIIADLENRKPTLIFKKEKIIHTYPFCWRCKSPLIYYARSSWYIKMSALRDELLSENQKINWQPAHIREGRFGEWLREVKDWAISRERYWGTPLPIWYEESSQKTIVIGSLEELKGRVKKSGNKYLVMRHGEAENNVKGILSSRADNPHQLTEKGCEEVLAAAQKLKEQEIDLIITSDFVRAKETAKIIAKELSLPSGSVVFDERLREVNHGDLNLRPAQEYYDYFASPMERFSKSLPNGENFTEIKQRLGALLYELETKYQGKNILLVSHESPLWLLFAVAAGANNKEALAIRGSDEDFMHTAESRELNFVPLPHDNNFELDLHRPHIDRLELVGENGESLQRVPEVMDVWFDSGAMPFAEDHYPFETTELVYPADYIVEAVDQTRGWFYTLLAVGVLMERGTPYRNAISLGHVLDKEGKKMSKSLGNAPDPWQLADKYGVDVLRFWMYMVNQPGDSKIFDETSVAEVFQKVFNPLFNVLRFFELYAGERKGGGKKTSGNVLDRWIQSRLHQLVKEVGGSLDRYEITEPARAVRDFIADLSQWYLRRSRDRFRGEDSADRQNAVDTTFCVLETLARLLAPFAPFTAEDIFRRLRRESDPESVHLTDWPEGGEIDEIVLTEMAAIRQVVSSGLELRASAGMKIRQPLALFVTARSFAPEYLVLVRDELNVEEVHVDETLDQPVYLETKLTPELKKRGELRELVRELQDWRKRAGLKPGEMVEIPISKTKQALVSKFEAELKKAVSASEFVFTD